MRVFLFLGVGIYATSTLAAVDPIQLENMRKYHNEVVKGEAVETAKDVKREELLTSHMMTLQELKQKINTTKPKANMTPQELSAWYEDNLKWMNQALDQMIADHQEILDMKCSTGIKGILGF